MLPQIEDYSEEWIVEDLPGSQFPTVYTLGHLIIKPVIASKFWILLVGKASWKKLVLITRNPFIFRLRLSWGVAENVR